MKEFDWAMYPDKGLGPQYHKFEDTFSIGDLFHIEVFKVSFEQSREHRNGRCEPRKCKMCRWTALRKRKQELRFSS